MTGRVVAATVAALAGLEVFHYVHSLNLSEPVVAVPASPAAAAAPGPARRVVWILVDGLRLDASRSMPELARLRARGIDLEGRAAFPTYSIPNYVTQSTGLDPVFSGVRTNDYPTRPALDSVFRRAREAGMRVAAVSTTSSSFTRYFGPWIDEGRVSPRIVAPPDAALALVHLGEPDKAAHDHGAASPEYAAAVAAADAVIGGIARTLDATRDSLVVTSDHGHLDRGGHGGTEPEVVSIPIVLWGAGAQPGAARAGPVQACSVGPTIAALLGTSPLAHARCRPIAGIDRDRGQRAAVAAAAAAWSGGASARLWRARAVSVPIALAVGAALFWIAWRARPGRRAWLLAPVYLGVLAALYALTDSVSFSSTNERGPFILRFAGLASAAAVAQILVGGRRSALPAALFAWIPALVAAWLVPQRPVADLPGPGACFFPTLAFGALAAMAAWAAVWGRFRPP